MLGIHQSLLLHCVRYAVVHHFAWYLTKNEEVVDIYALNLVLFSSSLKNALLYRGNGFGCNGVRILMELL